MKLRNFRFYEKYFNSASLGIIAIAIVLIIIGVTYYVQQEKARKAIEKQTSVTNQLILDVKKISEEIKALGEQNKELSRVANDYAHCNAVLFSTYTQTLEAITIENLEKCVYTSFPNGLLEPQQSTIYVPYTPQQPTATDDDRGEMDRDNNKKRQR